jgi:hypothetical protein
VRDRRQRLFIVLWASCLCLAGSISAVVAMQAPAPASTAGWLGHAAAIEAQLKTADVESMEDIGVGVTHPRRAHLKPSEPVESLVWKVLPPGRRGGYWESYKSEIAAYELDKLLELNMVPPAVERRIDGEVGAAVMWLPELKSVKDLGGKVPTGPVWGKPLRKMLMFDNLISNSDRNAGNIMVGQPGELILIDHSRAFVTETTLPKKIERVDAGLWARMQALTRDDLVRVLGPWIESEAIDAMLQRRARMVSDVEKLVRKKGRASVIIE